LQIIYFLKKLLFKSRPINDIDDDDDDSCSMRKIFVFFPVIVFRLSGCWLIIYFVPYVNYDDDDDDDDDDETFI